MPKVSVIIPCYNLGQFLHEAISSVLEQTWQDFEIIVVNDGSTEEETRAILSTGTWPKTRVIHQKNLGVSAARNRGISEAKGEFILPLDADDRIRAYYLERAVSALEKDRSVGIVFGRASYFGEWQGPMPLPSYSQEEMLWNNCIFSAALFRREDWKKVGGYRSIMKQGWEDWDFWLTLIEQKVEVVFLDDVVLDYRIRNNSRDRGLGLGTKGKLFLTMVAYHPGLYWAWFLQRTRNLVNSIAFRNPR